MGQTKRPTRDDVNNIAIFKQIIDVIKQTVCVIVFIFCDESKKFNKEKVCRWYKALVDGIVSMTDISEDRMFLFHGDPEVKGATTTEAIQERVASKLPVR